MAPAMDPGELAEWAQTSAQLQQMWFGFLAEQAGEIAQKAMAGQALAGKAGGEQAGPKDLANKAARIGESAKAIVDPAQWLVMSQAMLSQFPARSLEASSRLAKDTMEMWQSVLGQFAGGAQTGEGDEPALPRKDRRFADPAWRQHPAYALLHQAYLMLSSWFRETAASVEGLDAPQKQQLRFAVDALADAMSPANFLATNPVVLERTVETRGQNLVRGMRHLINDLKRGQLTHTDPDAFRLGENLAATPGKVVHETDLFQLIQYSPATGEVYEVPLVIFPPWINRFYILDLTPKKSFIKWAVDQGLSVFVVSWKSADESMADIVWDDYIRAQIGAIDHVRERLGVPHVHTIGYCVAGTTLAATLAVLARRGEADKVKSATFFTAQVDFERSGDLKHFISDAQLDMIGQLSSEGYLDGRYLAATFNALRGKDLIWNYVVNNYLLGEDYPAFDLLHWNGDVTNLPAKWHNEYLRDLYRDNRLVERDALSADGTPIDLTRVETPTYVQAGREDHIAPAESVWRITDHFAGPLEFVLAGSGHIAGVVNPPAAGKYQYWTGDAAAPSLDAFVEGAEGHPGSWWPHWLDWIETQDKARVPATGKRKPGGRGDTVIENAPGRYVKTR
ncbi:PHA/PHB synthase family protein [Qipengyuania nanhaisediminis]|uniref:PHA/PHB synthase family protein n=1 Tax=Qipengyuania nanhaisediminis TaxID=604088 RepID=UPI0038B275C6